MDYRREIDGLRAMAVLPVIFFHAGLPPFYGGYVGVDIFFVISGYLITSIILTDLKTGCFSLANFYERRVRRILPALFLVMTISLAFAWFLLLPGDMKDFSRSIGAVAVFASNFLFWSESGYFSAAAELKPMLHTWSLAVEEQYYVIFPIFMVLVWRLGQRWLSVLLTLIVLLSLTLAQTKVAIEPMMTFFLLPTRAWELLIGALAAFYLAERTSEPNARIANVASMVGMTMIFYAVFFFTRKTPVPSLYTLIPIFGALLIILFATPRTAAGKILGSSIAVGIGLISYSAYLWHQPIFVFTRHAIATEPGHIIFCLLSIVVLLLAYLSWRYVEKPFRNKNWLSKKTVFILAIVSSLVFIGIGMLGSLTNGFEKRFPIQDRELWSIRKIDAGEYVGTIFNSLILKIFDTSDPRKKVLLIGDSYAQDLVNAVYETRLKNSIQLSTFHIASKCGNLYLKTDFSRNIEPSDLSNCKRKGWYNNKELHKLMEDADTIWLASNWRYWQAELLPKSIENIERDFNKSVVVFGTKNFGKVNIKQLIQYPQSERVLLKNILPERVTSVNGLMRSELDSDTFIDVSGLLCKSHKTCRLFTDEGKLISYDGGHLTADGAKYYGQELLKHPLIKPLLRTESSN